MNGDGGCFAPTLDHDDAVYVIRHGDEGIQFNQREIVRDGAPRLSLREIWVVLVLVPASRIAADAPEVIVASNNMFVAVALPQSALKRHPPSLSHAHDLLWVVWI